MGSWKESRASEIRSFLHADEDLVIHIIKTGFNDTYIVVYEDAYEQQIGDTKVLDAAQVKEEYDIEL